MSYFVIIRGPLGSGKSILSNQLAETLGAYVVNVDNVLEQNQLDQTAPESSGIPVENFIQANEIVLPKVKDLLKNGQSVIFDGCFYYQQTIEHLIKSIPYPHYVFTLKAPLEMCIQRDSSRSKTYGEDAARAVHGLVSQFDYGISIDVTGSIDDALRAMLSELPK